MKRTLRLESSFLLYPFLVYLLVVLVGEAFRLPLVEIKVFVAGGEPPPLQIPIKETNHNLALTDKRYDKPLKLVEKYDKII